MTYNFDLGVKKAVKDWLNNRYENWIKQPIEKKTIELENLITQQVNNAQTQANKYNPVNYYQTKPLFHRGIFWICVLILIVLWIISS